MEKENRERSERKFYDLMRKFSKTKRTINQQQNSSTLTGQRTKRLRPKQVLLPYDFIEYKTSDNKRILSFENESDFESHKRGDYMKI